MIRWTRLFCLPLFSGLLALGGPNGTPVALAGSTTDTDSTAEQTAQQDVLLTLELAGGDARVHQLTLADLQALGAESFETATIWTKGQQEFTGVSLAQLATEFGLTEGVLQARAVNDYMVEVPLADAVQGGPIIAYERNGKPMSLRSKGPLWLVYPYDSNPAYQNEIIYSRSIWQLDRLTVTPAAE
ncbi:molybdopterin-dependent oxidoreductase [Pseudophaeobacter sp.]|uniref:molybdopterin-dependent oxidoreductase n=1 Tax=Pseudophaeobacter sp. TaxID=1971739 RepID=UPI00405A4973